MDGTLRSFLAKQEPNKSFTFIKMEARRRVGTPFYEMVYSTTSIGCVYDWQNSSFIDKYIVVSKDHPPIDVDGGWQSSYKKGSLGCCVITTEQDLLIAYGGEQGQKMIEHYKEKSK